MARMHGQEVSICRGRLFVSSFSMQHSRVMEVHQCIGVLVADRVPVSTYSPSCLIEQPVVFRHLVCDHTPHGPLASRGIPVKLAVNLCRGVIFTLRVMLPGIAQLCRLARDQER